MCLVEPVEEELRGRRYLEGAAREQIGVVLVEQVNERAPFEIVDEGASRPLEKDVALTAGLQLVVDPVMKCT
ncbi:MAG: hypothetical protein R3E12_18860 [Candidatus Eisenbacteria bacterium]